VKVGIRSKLFLLSFGLIAAALVAADSYLSGALDRSLTARIREDLAVRLDLVEHEASASSLPLTDVVAWDSAADDMGRLARARVTVVRRDGTVLGDSDVRLDQIARMENHADRPEIAAALSAGYGESSRNSATLNDRMLYLAKPFRRGSDLAGVVRLALPLASIDQSIAAMRRLLVGASVLALALAAVLSGLAAHLASRTVRALNAAARTMAGGDLTRHVPSGGHDELAEMGHALSQLASSLSRSLTDLRSERDLLGGILTGMREGVLLLDREGRVALVNPSFREMFLIPSEVTGRPLLEVVRHAELKSLVDQAGRSLAAVSGEIEVLGIKPRRLLVHASNTGTDRGALVVLVDVTEVRRLELVRRDFVASAAEELRAPIASARSALETLGAAMKTDADAAGELVGVIDRNVERLHRLIEDLLDLSRIESREFTMQLEPVELAAVTESTLAVFRDAAIRKRMHLEQALPAGLPAVRADRRGVGQVLANLLDNAIKYCPEESTVRIGARLEGSSVRVSVEDDGPGIEPRHLPRLFERFYRVDAGRSRELGGTGLGLSIVKHLVEAMGGVVAVESTPRQGSSFSFTLPRFHA
jgi:two-component system phosphate regulon sensor histidine kinase PhoR